MVDGLLPCEIRIACRVTEDLDDGAYREALAALSMEELSRHDRLRFARDRRDYASAHALLRAMLSAATGLPPSTWRFDVSASGKPTLSSPSASLSFNLSHTHGMVACAVAAGFDVGIDVETIDRAIDIDTVADLHFSTPERDHLRGLLDDRRRRIRFFELWTLKEAFLKANGVGLSQSLQFVSFDLERGDQILFAAPTERRDGNWQFALFAPTPAHRLAVAARSADRVRLAADIVGTHVTSLTPLRQSIEP